MGGRGQSHGKTNRQMKIEDIQVQNRIDEILKESEQDRSIKNGLAEISNAVIPELLISYRQCACCEEYTIPYNAIHYKCPICGWIDDKNQNSQTNNPDGLNPLALNEAKENYKKLHRGY